MNTATATLDQPLKKKRTRGMSVRRKKSLIRRILAEKDKVRASCERAESLLNQLRDGVEIDREVIELDPLTRYQVVDNFAQPAAGKYTRINRFDLKKLPSA
jgi:hypothetical protein